jgi:O-antigen ligase
LRFAGALLLLLFLLLLLRFSFFDRERKAVMGTLLAVTAGACVVSGFGAFALSTRAAVLELTAWGVAVSRFDASGGGDGDGASSGGQVNAALERYIT